MELYKNREYIVAKIPSGYGLYETPYFINGTLCEGLLASSKDKSVLLENLHNAGSRYIEIDFHPQTYTVSDVRKLFREKYKEQ